MDGIISVRERDTALRLKMISNRGTKVYPLPASLPDLVEHWRCRFILADGQAMAGDAAIFDLLERIGRVHRWMHVEKLQHFDGAPGYSLA